MYLKSLVLKGFKSFADRSVLTLEPGITAIVGPNGSGKSNISDAVLWVLGERSARNLRGQSMEDIIFSGSAARKAVSVAEVDLVLDNSDHVLPVDFDEVVIARRMYRSGESEYLVNGVVVRRLDVLDILHDSGLGTGTHSIISQGSLDSILQSRPEDRRALIEEAAGVLKHKRRKEKSARKLEQMENHLARARDVTAEVARQLGPLERKARRAEAYAKAQGELHEVRLALAVDDLRQLRREWDAVCASEQSLERDVDSKRALVEAAERKVNDCQEILRRDSEDAGVLARNQRRASNLNERLDGAELLLRERRRVAEEGYASMTGKLDGSAGRRAEALSELESVNGQLGDVRAQAEAAERAVEELYRRRLDVDERKRGLETEIGETSRSLKSCEKELERAKSSRDEFQRSLANGVAQVQMARTRKAELEESRFDLERGLSEAALALDAAREKASELAAREEVSQKELASRFAARDAAHARRDALREDAKLADAEAAAIDQALQTMRGDDPALSWVVRNAGRFAGQVMEVSKAFRVTRGLESLVERLLGADLSALAVEDPDGARAIAACLEEERVPGDLTLVVRDDGAVSSGGRATSVPVGCRLVDELSFADEMRPVVEALFGDVVLCDDRDAAFKAHALNPDRCRYLSRDGCVVWPTGKVQVLGAVADGSEGVIARERRLSELRERASALARDLDLAETAVAQADAAYREWQSETLKLAQELANARGALQAASAEEERARKRVESALRDIDDAQRKIEVAGKEVGDLEEGLRTASERVEELAERREQLASHRRTLQSSVNPLRDESTELGERYNEARLESARLAERRSYVERLAVARQRDIEVIDAEAAAARVDRAVKAAVIRRSDEAIAVIERIATCLSRRVRLLDEAVNASASTTSSVHADAANARDEARKAHDDYDAATSKISQVRVDKGRLEMRVEAAVNVIVKDLGTPIDKAQLLPALEDRAGYEDESFKLTRKIKNMGTINPDAAAEYAALKERYDYLAGQLADMEAAKRSLNKIVRVIDARMKDDFARTFEQVNNNFNEIFAELFPGGTAHLSLEDPDDLDNTGVEVTAQPAGKRLTKMMLMSGGEKSLTALALLFAVYKTRATPFYILDEVEAALDDTNLRRLALYIDSLRETTQLIMITHQRRTMEMADVLFGVSMHSDGVTKVISQKLDRALELAEG